MIKNLKQFRLLCALLIITFDVSSIALAKIEAILGPVPLALNQNLALIPQENQESEVILSKPQYVVSYNKHRRNPNWVAWKLESSDLGKAKRTNRFSFDPDLERYLLARGEKKSVRPEEYKASCFDRGHQIPSADRTTNTEDNQATFLMSNMVPQTPYLNRVMWVRLENYTRSLVRQGKKVYVIAGPVFDANFGKIGPQKDIQVPSKNFKVLMVLDENQTFKDINPHRDIIAVVLPNTQQDGGIPYKHADGKCATAPRLQQIMNPDWRNYIVSLRELEQISGFRLPGL